MTQIGCVIKEDGTTEGDAGRAHPPQCAVRIDHAGCKMTARPFNHDVVVAQVGVICTRFQDRRILVSARVVESRGCNCDIGLLRRAVHEPISQRNGVAEAIVKSVDRQNNIWRMFEPPAREIVVGISA